MRYKLGSERAMRYDVVSRDLARHEKDINDFDRKVTALEREIERLNELPEIANLARLLETDEEVFALNNLVAVIARKICEETQDE